MEARQINGYLQEKVSQSRVRWRSKLGDKVYVDPIDVDGNGYFLLTTGLSVKLTTQLNCDIVGTSGAGGLDTGVFTDNRGYYIYFIVKDSDGTQKLLASLSSTSPTMPAGYSTRTPAVFFTRSGVGALYESITIDGGNCCVNSVVDAQNKVLTGGTATVATAVDLTDFVPDFATYVDFAIRAGADAPGFLAFYSDAADGTGQFNAAGDAIHFRGTELLPVTPTYTRRFRAPKNKLLTNSFTYAFSSTYTNRLVDIFVVGWGR